MINGYKDEVCNCKAVYFENGSWYCGKHSPSKIEERQLKSYQKWLEKIESNKSKLNLN